MVPLKAACSTLFPEEGYVNFKIFFRVNRQNLYLQQDGSCEKQNNPQQQLSSVVDSGVVVVTDSSVVVVAGSAVVEASVVVEGSVVGAGSVGVVVLSPSYSHRASSCLLQSQSLQPGPMSRSGSKSSVMNTQFSASPPSGSSVSPPPVLRAQLVYWATSWLSAHSYRPTSALGVGGAKPQTRYPENLP